MEKGAVHILPFPETKPGLAAHFQTILDSYVDSDIDPEGAGERARAFVEYQEASRILHANRAVSK